MSMGTHAAPTSRQQGCLTFDGCASIGRRIASEVCTADQRTIEQSGFELWFIYANQLPFSALQVCVGDIHNMLVMLSKYGSDVILCCA